MAAEQPLIERIADAAEVGDKDKLIDLLNERSKNFLFPHRKTELDKPQQRKDGKWMTPLMLAAKNGHTHCVHALFQYGALLKGYGLDFLNNKNELTSWGYAFRGHLQNTGYSWPRDKIRISAIHYAFAYGHYVLAIDLMAKAFEELREYRSTLIGLMMSFLSELAFFACFEHDDKYSKNLKMGFFPYIKLNSLIKTDPEEMRIRLIYFLNESGKKTDRFKEIGDASAVVLIKMYFPFDAVTMSVAKEHKLSKSLDFMESFLLDEQRTTLSSSSTLPFFYSSHRKSKSIGLIKEIEILKERCSSNELAIANLQQQIVQLQQQVSEGKSNSLLFADSQPIYPTPFFNLNQ